MIRFKFESVLRMNGKKHPVALFHKTETIFHMIDIERVSGRRPPFVNLGSYPRLHRLENEAVVLADFAAICVKRGRAPAPSSCPPTATCPPTSSSCPPNPQLVHQLIPLVHQLLQLLQPLLLLVQSPSRSEEGGHLKGEGVTPAFCQSFEC